MPPAIDLKKFSFEELARVRASLVEDMDTLKKELKDADAEVVRRIESAVDGAYKESNKQHGIVRFEFEGTKVVVEIRKTVKWDQEDLTQISNKLPPEVAARVFEVELAIPEPVLEAMARTDLQLYTTLNTARTVKFSKPSIQKIELPEAKQ